MQPSSLSDAIACFWKTYVPTGASVCVAVSGGADSTALFHALFADAKKLGITRLGIAHVNHGLRGGESDRDEQFVAEMAQKARVEFHCIRLKKKNIPQTGIEEWARTKRYEFFAKVKKQYAFDYFVTAHTQNDQAETVIMRLLRGSGVRGLAGISPVRDDGVIRPLLDVQKSDIMKWLRDRHLAYCEDSTNTDTKFRRNHIRHDVLPVITNKDPSMLARIASVAADARTVMQVIDGEVASWLSENLRANGETWFAIASAGFARPVIACEAIMELLRKRGVEFDRFHIDALMKNFRETGKTFLLPNNWHYGVGRNEIVFTGKKAEAISPHRLLPKKQVKISERGMIIVCEKSELVSKELISFSSPWVAYVDFAFITGKLVVRAVSVNDTFWPFGQKKYVNAFEFMKKQGCSKIYREGLPVVADDSDNIIWIPGLRIGEPFRISQRTHGVIKISCKPFP